MTSPKIQVCDFNGKVFFHVCCLVCELPYVLADFFLASEFLFSDKMKTFFFVVAGLFCIPATFGFVHSVLPPSGATRFCHLARLHRTCNSPAKHHPPSLIRTRMAEGQGSSTLDIKACSLDEWFSSNGYKIDTFSNLGGSGWVRLEILHF
jgi:hypothetical protein